MQLIDFYKECHPIDKEILLESYNKWNLYLYNQIYELNNNNLTEFLKDITNSEYIRVENTACYTDKDMSIFYVLLDDYSTSGYLDVLLKKYNNRMQLINIINNLKENDLEIFLEAYNKWCMYLYGKVHELNDNNIKTFIEDVVSESIYIRNGDVECKSAFIISYMRPYNYYVINIYFEKKLQEIINQCQ